MASTNTSESESQNSASSSLNNFFESFSDPSHSDLGPSSESDTEVNIWDDSYQFQFSIDSIVMTRLQVSKMEFPLVLKQFQFIKAIEISNCGISVLPPLIGSARTFCTLEKFVLSNNRLTQIKNLQIPSLQMLDLSFNSISDFKNVKLPRLHTLNLNKNNLSQLPMGFMTNSVPMLTTLYMKYNVVTELENLVHSPTDIPLLYLDCSHNHIRNIAPKLYKYFPHLSILKVHNNNWMFQAGFAPFSHPSLKILDIRKCELHRIHPSFLSENLLPELQVLDLSFNSINSIPDFMFPNLRKLLLSDCKITTIPPTFGVNIPKLAILDLYNNGIDSLPRLNLANLSSLNITYNPIASIQNDIKLTQLQSLTVSYQKLILIPSLKYFYQLKLFDCSHNFIRQIHPEFASKEFPMKELLTCKVSHNLLTTLDRIFHAPILHTLDISYNKIIEIDPDFCSQMPKLREFSLFNNSLPKISLTSLFMISSLSLEKNKLEHVTLKSMTSQLLKYLNLSKQSLKSFPSLEFPTLQYLNLSMNKIPSLPDEDINIILPHLKTLNLSNNLITGMFPKISSNSLLSLNMGRNRIKKIDPLDIQLPLLEMLNLTNNAIIILPNLDLPNLKSIFCSKNQLVTIHPEFGSKSPFLTNFNISQNSICSLPSFENNPQLKLLHIFRNTISYFPPSFGSSFQHITILDFSYQKFYEITPFSCTSLVKISFDHNTISELPLFFFSSDSFPNLAHFSIASNNIQHLPADTSTLKKLSNISSLSFRGNQLSNFPLHLTTLCPKLTTLNLSHNRIGKLPAFSNSLLYDLNVSRNSISIIDPDFGKNIPKLEILDISDNRIIVLPDLVLPYVSFFKCSGNMISTVSGFGNHLNLLETLDLSHQQIQDLKHFRPPFVQKLDLTGNKISQIPETYLAGQSLRYLILSDNKISRIRGLVSVTLYSLHVTGNPIIMISSKINEYCPNLFAIYISNSRKSKVGRLSWPGRKPHLRWQ